MNRWRSERCERTFAHVCETGGGRRAWLRGQLNVSKAHTLKCAAYNLGLLLRKIWGYCKPRNAEAAAAVLYSAFLLLAALIAVAVIGKTNPMIGLWLGGLGLLLVMAPATTLVRVTLRFWKNRHS